MFNGKFLISVTCYFFTITIEVRTWVTLLSVSLPSSFKREFQALNFTKILTFGMFYLSCVLNRSNGFCLPFSEWHEF